MVARGDLGVEMGYAELAGLQKQIIQEARHQNRVVIMATQMMESMIVNTIPTRAEVSDVANAVMDGSDAVMLSAETAAGKHPTKVVEAMAQIIVGAEKYQGAHVRIRQRNTGYFDRANEAIAAAVMYTANHLHVKAIVALTESGETALWMSRVRSDIPIYAFTRQEITRCRVTLYRGVYPVAYDVTDKDREAFYFSIFRQLLDLKLVDGGRSRSFSPRASSAAWPAAPIPCRSCRSCASSASAQKSCNGISRHRPLHRDRRIDGGGERGDGAVAPAVDQGRARYRQDAARGRDRPLAVEAAVRMAHQVHHQGAAGLVRIRRRVAPARFAARRSARSRTSAITSSRAISGRPSIARCSRFC